jgi:hypothetical protein
LNPGLLKLFARTKDFNPKLQHNTSAQVWVKFFGLSQEYWHKNILFTIAGSLGTPICIDSVTAKPMHERTFGQFARVLVDIDLLQPLRYKLLVERKGYAFFVELEYEYIPNFCHGCKVIGHNFDQCKKWNKEADVMNAKDSLIKKKAPSAPKKTFVPVTRGKVQHDTLPVVVQHELNKQNNKDNEVIHVEESSVRSPQINMVDNGGNATPVNNDLTFSDTQMENRQLEPVLTPLSPRTIQQNQDALLEHELNNNDSDSDSCSQGSLVKDSQAAEDNNLKAIVVASMPDFALQDANLATHHVAGASSQPNQPPDRVLKDMAFLKESWANMTEAEEDAHEVLNETDQMEGTTADGFQIHLSKNQKKIQKKLKQSSKDSYATRSKVAPKPFR